MHQVANNDAWIARPQKLSGEITPSTDVTPTLYRRETDAYFASFSGECGTLNSSGIGIRLNASKPAIL